MTREIRFRGRRLDNGEWVSGHYFVAPLTDENSGVAQGYGWCFPSDGTTRHCISQDGVAFVVDPATVGQYTGLKDKNGKEVYEGDILGVIDPNGEPTPPVEVKWDAQAAAYSFEDDFDGYDVTSLGWAMQMEYQFEVIGNVIDNPELLERSAKNG